MEYLGFWVNRKGVHTISKKVEAIVNMDLPKYKWGIHSFISLIKYYTKMWDRRYHTTKNLTILISENVKFKCTYLEQ